ncbi:hypothetical protein CVM73_03455 [Bradyrhizobium forestalis]|uniref:Uncharacterized protein n=1 Tax=Bradyrhizobium forestalis TaxID=1419263 RepID=A0A2M8RFM4_9BRAD|nr:hypothetical protein [Bradyrhizobium forestalis]PJG56619.1 hypothetical protein CVM73_03455 [Bradyrhizobium forestalis]
MSNVIAFPRGGCVLRPSNVTPIEVRVERGRRRTGPNMHTFVFRSYELILASSEADLVRDVRFDLEKAQTKLKTIQQQLERDREHAAARADLLSRAEARLSAAIAAAHIPVDVSHRMPADEASATNRQRASRRRNPLRHPCHSVDHAVTVIGMLLRRDPLPEGIDGRAIIRKGAAAARHLAEELERVDRGATT